MMFRTYIITFWDMDYDTAVRTKRTIEQDRHVFRSYWNYIPNVYCVKSEFPAQVLSSRFEPWASKYLVAEINELNVGGLLPREAWDWFRLPVSYLPTSSVPEAGSALKPETFSSTKKSL